MRSQQPQANKRSNILFALATAGLCCLLFYTLFYQYRDQYRCEVMVLKEKNKLRSGLTILSHFESRYDLEDFELWDDIQSRLNRDLLEDIEFVAHDASVGFELLSQSNTLPIRICGRTKQYTFTTDYLCEAHRLTKAIPCITNLN